MLDLAYSEYSRDWTNIPLVEAILDQSFVHMTQVRNPSHRPPGESSSSSSEEETTESEDEELLDKAENFRRRGRAQGRGRYSRGFVSGRFDVGRSRLRGGGRFRGGSYMYRGRGRGRGSNRARGCRARLCMIVMARLFIALMMTLDNSYIMHGNNTLH